MATIPGWSSAGEFRAIRLGWEWRHRRLCHIWSDLSEGLDEDYFHFYFIFFKFLVLLPCYTVTQLQKQQWQEDFFVLFFKVRENWITRTSRAALPVTNITGNMERDVPGSVPIPVFSQGCLLTTQPAQPMSVTIETHCDICILSTASVGEMALVPGVRLDIWLKQRPAGIRNPDDFSRNWLWPSSPF